MKKLIFYIILTVGTMSLKAQVGIGTKVVPKYSALEISSAQALGLSLPKLTTAQRDSLYAAITVKADAAGLVIYNTDLNELEYFNGASWLVPITAGTTADIKSPSGTVNIANGTGAVLKPVTIDFAAGGIPANKMGSNLAADTNKIFATDASGNIVLDSFPVVPVANGLTLDANNKIGLGSLANPGKIDSTTTIDLKNYNFDITSQDHAANVVIGGTSSSPVFNSCTTYYCQFSTWCQGWY